MYRTRQYPRRRAMAELVLPELKLRNKEDSVRKGRILLVKRILILRSSLFIKDLLQKSI